jgi:hypothetical protein
MSALGVPDESIRVDHARAVVVVESRDSGVLRGGGEFG